MSDLIKRLHGIANNVDFNLTVYAKREIRTGADEIEHLTARIEKLEVALGDLLEDTQHSEHDCGDHENCPVIHAIAALEAEN